MGRTAVYLLPDLGDLSPTDYNGKAKAVLAKLGVIHGEAGAHVPNSYSPGDKSLEPFENDVGWEYGFEDCIIYGSARISVVPIDPAVDPCCPKCSFNVNDVYYDVICNAYELEPEKPDDALRIRCPNCGEKYRLDQLVDDTGIFLVNAYVNFDDIPGSLRPEWLSEFDQHLGLRHRCLQYGYT